MLKEKVPMKIVVPIIVVTWVLSLVSALAIVTAVPGLAVKDTTLAAGAIPFAATYGTTTATTTSTSWMDVPAMAVSLILVKTSNVSIMFSSEAWLSAAGDYILVRALVDSTEAHPGAIYLTGVTSDNAGSYSHLFYLSGVSAGAHTVKIQWYMDNGNSTGSLGYRTMAVIALPA